MTTGARAAVLASVLLAAVVLAGPARATTPDGAVPPDAVGAAAELHQAVAASLAPRRFEFCHDSAYPLTKSEKRWCDLGAGKHPACPTLAEACKREAMAQQLERDDSKPFSITLPDLGLPFKVLLWTLLAVGLLLLLFALIRQFLDHKHKDVLVTEAPASASAEAAAALARQVETDVQRLLERARAEAAAGDYRAAIGTAYAALLRRLEGAGVVRVEPDQTNGDYLGMVRRERPALAPRMAEVVDSVEHAQFGHADITRDRFDGVWLRVTGLLAERIGVLLLVLGLLLGGCGMPRSDWDHSPSGRAAVLAFLGKRAFTLRERLSSLGKLGEGAEGDGRGAQLLLLPGAEVTDPDWQALKRWLDGGERSLVIAGGNRKLPDWIGMRIALEPVPATQPIRPSDADLKRWGALVARSPSDARLVCEPDSEPLLVRGGAPYAAQRWFGDDEDGSRVLLIADDLLLRNASLLVADNAAVLDALLRDGGSIIEWAGDLTGRVASNPVESVQRGRLGPALLQLTAFLLLFFVAKGARFGRPTQVARTRRRELGEHVRALGLHYARARADRHALGALGGYVIERLRERFRLQSDRSLSGLAEAVAARTGRPVGELMRMFVEARDAGKGVAADQEARDLETARELCKLLEETGGTGGHKPLSSNL